MPYQDSTANSVIIPQVWSARFYEVLRASQPFLESIITNRDYEGEITDLGNILNISTITDFDDATELPEGSQGDTEVATVSGQQLTINKRTYKDFKVTKTALKQSLPFMDSLREKAVFAINKRIQQVIIDNTIPSASAPDHQIGYTSSTTLALVDFLAAKKLLDAANVDMVGRAAVLGSNQWNDLFNFGTTSGNFLSRDFIPSGSPMTTGQFQTDLLGFTPRMTTVVGNTCYFLHPSYLTVAIQEQLNVAEYDLGSTGERGFRVNSDLLWGLKLTDNKRVVTIS